MIPKVSIIIPVYNAEDGVEKCLDSVLNQTFLDYEIILLNDGSTDKSIDILKSYESKYNNIIVVDKENEGVAKTRNRGISMAKGDYIMFIDNDDFIDKDYIEKFYNKIEQTKSDIVIGGYRRVNSKNKIIFQEKLIDSEWTKYIYLAPWAKIYRREFVQNNNIQFLNFPIGEDLYFSFRIYKKTTKITILNYIGYNWFYNDQSISNTVQRGLNGDIDVIYLLDKILEIYDQDRNEYIRYFFKRYYIWYLLFSGRNASKKDFVHEYKKLTTWVKENDLNRGYNIYSSKYNADRFKIRIYIWVFDMIEKLRLVPLFANFYCKFK